MSDLLHLTILNGHARMSPRGEVADHVISGLQKIIAEGTDWRFLNELKHELKA